jgi:hypothetical protein
MRPSSPSVFCSSLSLVCAAVFSASLWAQDTRQEPNSASESGATEQVAFFEKHIRPLLVRECYECHAATSKQIEGGLTLDTREGIRKGGDSGPAVVPGDVAKSLLLKAVRQTSDELKMPPDKKLSGEEIALLEQWIQTGAIDPRDGVAKLAREEIDIEKGRQFWSFQPLKNPPRPAVRDVEWPRREIDYFILAALETEGLLPVTDAELPALLRRLSFDLIGLPPTPEELSDFLAAAAIDRDEAIAKTVDRLLASPQFGERWGRHWLDVARYAESSGRSANFAYPHAWRYRDYVIAAFRNDKPFNQFVREQLAGDLLRTSNDTQRAEFQIATGFLAIGPKALDERNPRQFQMDLIDEQIDATFQAFQGLTVACARCHDHKFDPIPQRDYYALVGIFRNTETCYGTLRLFQSNHPSALVNLPREGDASVPLPPMTDDRRDGIRKQIGDLRQQASQFTGQNAFIQRIFVGNRITLLQHELAQYDSEDKARPQAMGVRDRPPFSHQVNRLLIRGELSQLGEVVDRGFPQVLSSQPPDFRWGASGRRELADFLASDTNPLTARVMVNRIWLHLIGRGIVATPDNFGASGQPPSHPDLLDRLAGDFLASGWSVKNLIREIVLSRTYQMGSQRNDANFEADPDNVLVWRIPKRRIEAEALRDAMLAAAGRLNLTPPPASPIYYLGEGDISFRPPGMGLGRAPFDRSGPGRDPIANDTHRSVYLPIVRDRVPEMLVLFDFPDPSLIAGERATTNVPAQSLFLLNNPFVLRQTEGLADRLLTLEKEDTARIKLAYALCYSREPSETEVGNALKYLSSISPYPSRRSAWTSFCHALLASAEFSQR